MNNMIDIICFVLGTVLILIGLFVIVGSVIGNYKFNYVLNRMHVSAMSDILGLLSVLLGLFLYRAFDISSLKLVLVILFFWLTSPVSAHLLARMEVLTHENLDDDMEVL